jgi:hypothetical protein
MQMCLVGYEKIKKMKIRAFIVNLLICSAFSACCTKRDCDAVYKPVIIIQLLNFNASDIQNTKIYIQDKITFLVKDSITMYYTSPIISLDEAVIDNSSLRNQGFELKDFAYKVRVGGIVTESLHAINYEQYTRKVDCNSCFPTGIQRAIVNDFKDFSYSYGGRLYHRKDTLQINQ